MAALPSIPTQLLENGTVQQLTKFLLGVAIFYLSLRSLWRLYFQPLSKFPGPKLAAVSDIWYAYQLLTGRGPCALEEALKKYGNVVRIAPNELLFVTPQAMADIYGSHNKYVELFPKTQINNHGNDEHGGLIWEWDPIRHRQVAKQISPAFSGRALKAKEATLHKYVDIFVERMREFGGGPEGASLPKWTDWLCVDISADMAYNREMDALKNMQSPPYLDLLAGFSKQLIPKDREPPKDPKEMRHLEQVAGQLLAAGYEAPALWFYATIYHLLDRPAALETLTEEIRTAFTSYDEITASRAAELPYLTACLKESLRMVPTVLTGMPCVSPGAMVDGTWIPAGVVCQSSPFSMQRNPQNFHDPLNFRPERWLSADHKLYNPAVDSDARKDFLPFSQGPRMCTGREIAWWQSRVFLGKVLWAFDLQLVPGKKVDLDKELKEWGIFAKPAFSVRFVPVLRE
ncbi:hypothetical protein VPNG_08063 [Cytospora leucostoma]|uniref:Uncharacterized protein n=1 Tax=Cytospora leucostoma TaxID=1230097 RepID=A0A423WRY5_9PEZI|nr:hypothetical protein VPNG_08063 [Cytospora leucostoma]